MNGRDGGAQGAVVVLPVFNEEENLPELLRAASAHPSIRGVVAVDDGSTDSSPSILARRWDGVELHVVAHEKNMNLGPTIRDGLRRAFTLYGDTAAYVTMDADNSHPLELVDRMLEECRSGADVVVASRYVEGARQVGLSPLRRVLSDGANVLMRLLFPIEGLRDYTCGYRCFDGRFLGRLLEGRVWKLLRETHFTATAELILAARLLSPRVREVPLVLRYDLKKGSSKMRIAATCLAYLSMFARMRRIWRSRG